MLQQEKDIFGDHRPRSIREQLSLYFAYWPLFALLIALCVGAGILYTRYTPPKYLAFTSFLVKESEGKSSAAADLIDATLNGKRVVNLNSEIMLLKSKRLMERTVARHQFNISYFKKGRLLDVDIYNDAPFTLNADVLKDSTRSYDILITSLDGKGGELIYGAHKVKQRFVWNKPFELGGQRFWLAPKSTLSEGDGNYLIKWQPVSTAAALLLANLTVKVTDAKTNVLELTLKTENVPKGEDILNTLFEEFNLSDIEDRAKLSKTTVQFIEDRLLMISGELKTVEGSQESYQVDNGLVDMRGQSTQSLESSDATSRAAREFAIQQRLVGMTLDYFQNPANSSKLVPSVAGLSDPTLSSLIVQYNDLQLKKQREAPLVAPNSTVMQDLNSQIATLKNSIVESLGNINNGLEMQENNYRQQTSQSKSFLSSVPRNERILQEIKRKQSISEGLYLYLLQKREEAAISSTSASVSYYKQIDKAIGWGPVEPNKLNILLYTFALGFFLAFGIVYLLTSVNDKVTSKEDIARHTSIPVLGQISHLSKKEQKPVAVLERSLVSEQFRALRTSLSYLMKDKSKKVVLISSFGSGEGKSFISLNLAAVCAIPGKKVALLEFDIRQPVVSTRLQLAAVPGLSDYLEKDTFPRGEIMRTTDIPNLHIYPCGTIPANPADLLLSEKMAPLIATLRKEYDLIIIDSSPIGLVSDAVLLADFSDVILYVVRQGLTQKKNLDFLTEIMPPEDRPFQALILNDIKKGSGKDANEGYYYSAAVIKDKL